jgi:Flp pilus assembly protein TadG
MAQALTRRRVGRERERGAELIEFALILPLILVVLMGIFDFGFAFQRYEVITNAAREGARLGSLVANYTTSDIQGRVDAYCSAAGLPGGCPSSGVSVDKSAAANITLPGGGTQAGVQVTVTYQHQFAFLGPVMRLIGGASFGSVNLRATSRMRCCG